MKKNIIIIFFAIISFAGSTQNTVENRVNKAKEALSLSSSQVEEWKTIYEKYDTEMKSAMKNRNRNKMKESASKKEEELKGTLTEEQKVKYDEWVAEARK